MVDRLILNVERDIYLKPEGIYFVWTTEEQPREIGKIERNSTLIFNRMAPYNLGNLKVLEFIVLKPGSSRMNPENTFDFIDYEIPNLTEEGALRLLNTKDIEEAVITRFQIFSRELGERHFDSPVLFPKDIYVVMGNRENNRSNGKLRPGEKIPFQEIIDAYSMMRSGKIGM